MAVRKEREALCCPLQFKDGWPLDISSDEASGDVHHVHPQAEQRQFFSTLDCAFLRVIATPPGDVGGVTQPSQASSISMEATLNYYASLGSLLVLV